MDSAETLDDLEPSHCSVLFTYAVGMSLVAAAVCLLLWNEHRAGALSRALDQALEQVVHIEEGQAAPTNSTRLIHITGQLSSRQVAIDEAYNISVAAVKLRRLVEVYQWVEKSTYRQYGDSDGISMEKEYAYDYHVGIWTYSISSWKEAIVTPIKQELDWRSELVDCTSLTKVSCVNPMFPVHSMDFVLSEVYLGQLQLSDSLISMIDNFHPLDAVITDQGNKNFVYLTESGGTPEKPKVGDMRISFLVAGILGPQGDKVSIVSECDGHHLHPFKSTAGASVEFLEFGDVTAKVMFKQAYADNGLSTFLFRSIAWFVSFMGFSLLSPVLHIPSDALPWLRLLVPAETSPMEFSVYTWLIIVLFGWALARPLHAVLALLACLIPFVTTRRLHHEA
ncbi:transmembrane protein 43 isoform X2 [Dermacentor andersoni]|uniref:transmembrane protein 43 isoform X2 n=1 Tax=Dermacentor andersoni TaxID=34620 RepID=UPI00241681D8|nr:transmembrane protein 43-like isoform X2 [Dermacentor andersoni]